jgi:hypothetical protein
MSRILLWGLISGKIGNFNKIVVSFALYNYRSGVLSIHIIALGVGGKELLNHLHNKNYFYFIIKIIFILSIIKKKKLHYA